MHMRIDKMKLDFLNSQPAWAIVEKIREESRKIEEEKKWHDHLENALKTIPLRFRNKTFNNFLIDCDAQKRVKNIIESYAETITARSLEGSSLIFLGMPGTGKTFLALILYQYLAKEGYRVEYQPSLNFLRLLQEKQFESYKALEILLNFYKELPFLIIDEVTEGCGKGAYPADWERNLLRMLIDTRYQANRCTLIITNRNKHELTERLGEPIVDRLAEKGISLAFTWNSYRQK
jgi:DNA replication protein DnaC